MDKRFLVFLFLGLAVVAVGLVLTFSATQGAHLRLEGKILKVRVLPLNASASVVIVDFRASNPSNIPFVIGSLKILLPQKTGDPIEGLTVSKPEVNTIFQYQRILGPKYNDVVSMRDEIGPHATLDRMAAVRFEQSEAAINGRQKLRLRFEDVNGALAEISE